MLARTLRHIRLRHNAWALTALLGITTASTALAQDDAAPAPIRVLVLDGQNNHDWYATSYALRGALVSTGRFIVDVSQTPGARASREDWNRWRPDFGSCDVVVVDYNGVLWPDHVREGFVEFVREGGGVVFVHASQNPFPGWKEYNDMVGLGWRNNKFGNRLTIDDATGEQIITPRGEGPGAGHGPQHAYLVKVREPDHPIMRGIPSEWMHAKDELYHGQRGPAANMTVLSSAFSAKPGGTGEHEPMTWVIPFGKGRCVTNVMGHVGRNQTDMLAVQCVGFQTVFARCVEWAATEKVTLPIPDDFPGKDAPVVRAARLGRN